MGVVGIDAGGTSFKALLVASDGSVLARHRVPTAGPDETFAEVARWIDRLRSDGQEIGALGIASFGPVDRDPHSADWGRIGITPKAGWQGANPRAALEHLTGIPCGLDTDVNGALLAEAEAETGAGRGLADVAYITVGTGVGGAALVGGNLVGAPQHGEFGHVRVRREAADIAAFAGNCPFHADCVEGLAASGSIRARWGCEPHEMPDDHPGWEEVASALAQLCLSIAYISAPQRIILGGGLLLNAALFARIAEKFASGLAGYAPRAEMLDVSTYLARPAFGDDAGAMGGAVIARRMLAGGFA